MAIDNPDQGVREQTPSAGGRARNRARNTRLRVVRPLVVVLLAVLVALVALVALVVLGGLSALMLLPALGTARAGARWDGPLQLPNDQEALAWPQFGRDSTHSGAVAATGGGPTRGSVAWRVKTGGPIISSPVAGSDTVYIASSDAFLRALDAHSGRELWRYVVGPKLMNTTPVLAGGLLLVAGDYTWLYALDASSGKVIWRYDSGNVVVAAPSADPATQLAFLTSGNNLIALDIRTGARRWEFQITDASVQGWETVASPTVSGGSIFWAPGAGTRLFALDEATGKTHWTFDTADRMASTPVLRGSTLYVTTWRGSVFAIDTSTGTKRWEQKLGQSRPGEGSEATPSLDPNGNRLYVGTYQKVLYALDASTGAVLWHFNATQPLVSVPVATAATVYFASEDGNLYAANAANGKLRWKLSLGEMRSSPALSVGLLYVGTMTGEIVAVR